MWSLRDGLAERRGEGEGERWTDRTARARAMEREDSEVRGECRFPFLYPRGGRYRLLTFVGCSSIEAWLQPCVHGTDGLVRPVRRAVSTHRVRCLHDICYMISGLDVRVLYGLVRWVRIVCGCLWLSVDCLWIVCSSSCASSVCTSGCGWVDGWMCGCMDGRMSMPVSMSLWIDVQAASRPYLYVRCVHRSAPAGPNHHPLGKGAPPP